MRDIIKHIDAQKKECLRELECLIEFLINCDELQFDHEIQVCVCMLLRPHEPQPTRLLCPGDSPGKNTGVGIHAILQRIFPTQGLNLLKSTYIVMKEMSTKSGEFCQQYGSYEGARVNITDLVLANNFFVAAMYLQIIIMRDGKP